MPTCCSGSWEHLGVVSAKVLARKEEKMEDFVVGTPP